MTPAERIGQIMLEERQRTLADIASIDAPEDKKREIVAMVVALQEAINQHLASRESTLDARVIPAALSGMAAELGRVYKRMADEGLNAGSAQQN